MKFQFAGKVIDLSVPRVMGILNATPDSFFDGGRFVEKGCGVDVDQALNAAAKMVEAGAAFIDVGGESTRPGAESVGVQEEMDRVIPVVEAIHARLDVVVSVDTSSPELMREAALKGAGLINDVRALQRAGAVEAVAASGLPVCLMHMQGSPETMQNNPVYDDVGAQVKEFLGAQVTRCESAGIDRSRIILDPGFGFGKSDEHNLKLLKELSGFKGLGCPLLVGLSRKSLIGRLLNRELSERLPASLALALMAVQNGAAIVRVHDVAETVDVVAMCRYVQELG